ncbi:unnamed protein product [Aphanomyces euteiches]
MKSSSLFNMLSTANNNKALRIGFENLIEKTEPVLCRVLEGSVPAWLRNTALYRTAPGMFNLPIEGSPDKTRRIHHWFDGLGSMHQFHVRDDGSVWYHNRFIATGARTALSTSGRPPIMFGQPHDPCVTIFGKVAAVFNTLTSSHSLDDSNLNVTVSSMVHSLEPNTVAVKSDYNCLQLVDADTFETKKVVRYDAYDPKLNGAIAASHEEFDPVTNEYFNINMDRVGKHTGVFSMNADGVVREAVITTPPGRPSVYVHSFSSTAKYLILTTTPCVVDPLKTLWYNNLAEAMTWQGDKHPVLFHVVERTSMTHVATFEAATPFYFFHSINAFDDGDDIVLDLVHYEDSRIVQEFAIPTMLDGKCFSIPSRYARYRLNNLSAHRGHVLAPFPKVGAPKLAAAPLLMELPTINERFRHCKAYQFVYAVNVTDKSSRFFDSVVKLDVNTGDVLTWAPGDGFFPGEPMFVPNPNEEAEDAGVLLTVVLDGHGKRSYLVVLDAKDLSVVARVEAPVVVPLGFHGMHKAK